jgi:photosystem II stability/assembly factor-like uncharacterized protein
MNGTSTKIYIATGEGVLEYNGSTWEKYTEKNNLTSGKVNWLFVSQNGTVYAPLFENGLGIHNDHGWTLLYFPEGLASSHILNMHGSNDGRNIYIATDYGLSAYDTLKDKWKNYTLIDGLGSNSIQDVFALNSGSIIYAATDNGLSITKDSGRTWQNYTTTQGLAGNTVSAVHSNETGKVIAAATSNGVSISTDGGATWNSPSIGSKNKNIYTVFVSGDGKKIYVGADGGVYMSADIGVTWGNCLSADDARRIYGTPDVSVIYSRIMIGSGLNVLCSTDGGCTWKAINIVVASGEEPFTTTAASIFDIYVSPDSSKVYILNNRATSRKCYISLNGGATWKLDYLGPGTSSSVYAAGEKIFIGEFSKDKPHSFKGGLRIEEYQKLP